MLRPLKAGRARLSLPPFGTWKGDAMKTLGDVQVGGSSTIVKLHGEGALRRHLMDLGLIKGTPFTVVKVAPLGDPIEITVRGYELSIRKEEAAIVEVQ